MTATPLDTWVLGAGGQARETVDLLRATGTASDGRVLRFVAMIDREHEAELDGRYGALVLGVGFPAVREALQTRFAAGFDFPVLIHPQADVGARCELGEATVVSSGCVITTDVRLGAGTLLNPRSGIGHDSVTGRWCVLNPGANVSGSVVLGDGVLVGSGATVLQGLTLGDGCVVGAGAVVTHDVPAGVTVVGVPARPVPTEPTP